MNVAIVVARYAESLAWINTPPFNTVPYVVYNKGPNSDYLRTSHFVEEIVLPNVGRCDHTYLHHIVHNYDTLADVTVFLPGSVDIPMKRNDAARIVASVLKDPRSTIVGHRFEDVRTQVGDFQLDTWQASDHTNAIENDECRLDPASPRPFGAWYEKWFGTTCIHYIGFCGIMAISREHIHNRPLSFYQALLQELDHHSNPEVGHYFERAWVAVFHPMDNLCVAPPLLPRPPPPPRPGMRFT